MRIRGDSDGGNAAHISDMFVTKARPSEMIKWPQSLPVSKNNPGPRSCFCFSLGCHARLEPSSHLISALGKHNKPARKTCQQFFNTCLVHSFLSEKEFRHWFSTL
ncbi:hypothetical protein CEXT_703241 [Caerostris extrusa]|uniref:Uncharacterized protein n=1 Tax=Caerostris extrusa TaxID=172846 RepID=A0AAV4WJ94_CAEEX|nr:hypothetical protein CEXT_703241 [Caerostris extrusa]